jgi:hypothetical protein
MVIKYLLVFSRVALETKKRFSTKDLAKMSISRYKKEDTYVNIKLNEQ